MEKMDFINFFFLKQIEEEKHGASKPKILSVDNYFISEKEILSGPFQNKQIVSVLKSCLFI